jgi:hypothetical protein
LWACAAATTLAQEEGNVAATAAAAQEEHIDAPIAEPKATGEQQSHEFIER